MTVALLSALFAILTIRKHIKKRSTISLLLILVFFSMTLGLVFSSFDDLLGWKDLLGEETWLGFGLGQIFNMFVNICYFALCIEIFIAKDKWSTKQILYFTAIFLIDLLASLFMMLYYLVDWPQNIIFFSIIHMVITAFCFILWVVKCTQVMSSVEDDQYRSKFQFFRISAIIYIFVVGFFAVGSVSDSSSFLTWIGMGLLAFTLIFSYKGFLAS